MCVWHVIKKFDIFWLSDGILIIIDELYRISNNRCNTSYGWEGVRLGRAEKLYRIEKSYTVCDFSQFMKN